MPQKRVDLLLRVWNDARRVTGGKLVVIGDGPMRQELEMKAGPGVEFAGKVTEEEKWRLLGTLGCSSIRRSTRAGAW